jgi:hypothetical protein
MIQRWAHSWLRYCIGNATQTAVTRNEPHSSGIEFPLATMIRNRTHSSEEDPNSGCQVTLGAGSLAIVGKGEDDC